MFDSYHPPTVAGDLQDEVGNPGDWDPASVVTEMADPDLDDIWEYTVVVPAGNYQCKVTLNKNWDQNTGPNVSFTSDGLSPITVHVRHVEQHDDGLEPGRDAAGRHGDVHCVPA